MSKSLQSARRQLLSSFFILSIIFFVGILVSYLFFHKSREVRQFRNEITNIHFKTTHMFNSEMNFLLSEKDDIKFHKNQLSPILTLQEDLYRRIIKDIDSLKTLPESKLYGLEASLDSLKLQITIHHYNLLTIKNLIILRGFKDYGTIGDMRKSIHLLEDNRGVLKARDILTLRRHEKDFLLRDDTVYANLLNRKANQLMKALNQNPDKNFYQIKLLKEYKESFDELARVIHEIGGFYKNGKMMQLQHSYVAVKGLLERLEEKAAVSEEESIRKIRYSLAFSIGILILFSIVTSIHLAHKRTQPIRRLASIIDKVSQSKNQFHIESQLPNASRELNNLLNSFKNLLAKLEQQFLVNQEKSRAVELQNKELKKVNGELDKFVYSVSHDLRAPLLSLMGLINISKNETDVNVLHSNLALQEKSANKLDSFIKDIIDLSRNSRFRNK